MSYQSAERIPTRSWKYDVYLTFRGEDTRHGFISFLHQGFKNAGIHAFVDDEELLSGEEIAYTILEAIEGSRVSVVILSEGYASSTWCLDELTKTIDCRATIGQIVLPVYYNISPTDVRNQRGSFGEDFTKHEHRFSSSLERVQRWRSALTQVTKLAGFEINKGSNRNEAEIVGEIVERVRSLLVSEELFITKHLVGVKSRMQDEVQILDYHMRKDDNVVLIGIWGMGGVGTTTFAKTVYNKYYHMFEGPKFLPNIREMWKNNQQVFLQEQLLNGKKDLGGIKIKNIESGVAKLKRRLCTKKALIVLDDVNNIDQLNALRESQEWFGAGSRIIITTRNRRLIRMVRVDHVHRVTEMDYNESLELLCWNAFT